VKKALELGSRDAVLGNANAPITLVEYGDYQCPFCTKFFTESQPQIQKDYIDTGKVKMIFRNFNFLGPESEAAAEAAECSVDQNKFWAYHNALYAAKAADEASGGGENDGFYTRALFLKLARAQGLNIAVFTSCIDGKKYTAKVAQEKSDAGNAGVNSTPTFFANGNQILGAQPYAEFKQLFDSLLKG
jgi:protein-disulfide isomerase